MAFQRRNKKKKKKYITSHAGGLLKVTSQSTRAHTHTHWLSVCTRYFHNSSDKNEPQGSVTSNVERARVSLQKKQREREINKSKSPIFIYASLLKFNDSLWQFPLALAFPLSLSLSPSFASRFGSESKKLNGTGYPSAAASPSRVYAHRIHIYTREYLSLSLFLSV